MRHNSLSTLTRFFSDRYGRMLCGQAKLQHLGTKTPRMHNLTHLVLQCKPQKQGWFPSEKVNKCWVQVRQACGT